MESLNTEQSADGREAAAFSTGTTDRNPGDASRRLRECEQREERVAERERVVEQRENRLGDQRLLIAACQYHLADLKQRYKRLRVAIDWTLLSACLAGYACLLPQDGSIWRIASFGLILVALGLLLYTRRGL